jgi:hypothetical protein
MFECVGEGPEYSGPSLFQTYLLGADPCHWFLFAADG